MLSQIATAPFGGGKRPRKNHESERICPTPFIRGACRGACPPSSISANLLQITGPFFPNFQFIVASSSQAPKLYRHLCIPFAPHRQLATGSLGNHRPPVSKRPAEGRMYHGECFTRRYSEYGAVQIARCGKGQRGQFSESPLAM